MVAVLALACCLVAAPAIVAGISMVDPNSLDQATTWFRRFSVVMSYVDYAKIFVALGSVIIVSILARRSRSREYRLETG